MPNQNYRRADGSYDGSGWLADQVGGALRQVAPLFNGLEYKGWNQTYGTRKSPARPEGAMATLNGKPVQWMAGPGGQMTWQPFETEGQMARAQARPARPEGSMATLNGKPVQWMAGADGQMAWQPFETEGQMARAQQSARPVAPLTAAAPTVGPLATVETPPQRAQLEERNRMLQQAGGANISQRLVPTEAEAAALNQRYQAPGFWASQSGKDLVTLANQAAAPERTRLADYYEAQRAVGIGAREEIVAGLNEGLSGDKAAAMRAWAEANPALALREFNKRFPQGEPTTGPSDAAIEQALQQGRFHPSEGSPQPLPVMPGPGAVRTEAPVVAPAAAFPASSDPGFKPEMEFVPQASAQSSNLNFNSPLPEINGAQALSDERTKALLSRYLPRASALNMPTYGT